MFNDIESTCSDYVNRYGFNSDHDWGDLYDHLMNTRIFTSIMQSLLVLAPKFMKQMAMGMI